VILRCLLAGFVGSLVNGWSTRLAGYGYAEDGHLYDIDRSAYRREPATDELPAREIRLLHCARCDFWIEQGWTPWLAA